MLLLHLNTHRRALLRSAAGGLRSRRLRPSSHAAAVARPKLYHLRGAGAAGTNRCDVRTDDGFSITTDTPRAHGGSNEAAQPVLLLLASLCGCEHATARFVAFKMRRRIGKVDFDIHAERDERGAIGIGMIGGGGKGKGAEALLGELPVPARLQRIWGSAVVRAEETDLTEAEVQVLAGQVHRRCPVANMVTLSGCELHIDWRLGLDAGGDCDDHDGSDGATS